MEGQERRLTDYHTVITTWGEGGSIKIPFIYTDIQGVTGAQGTPLHPLLPQGGAREGLLSPWVTWWGWRGLSLEECWGGRGGHLPRGRHLLPRQLLTLEALGSVWKVELRELEGRVVDWVCLALPLGIAQVQLAPWLPGRPRAGASGVPPSSSHPGLGGWRGGVRSSKRESGTFWHLGKADPQGHSALVVLPPEGRSETRSGCQG